MICFLHFVRYLIIFIWYLFDLLDIHHSVGKNLPLSFRLRVSKKMFHMFMWCSRWFILQKPIIIELYGYCTALRKTRERESTQIRFNYPTRLKNGFEGYTSDTVVATQNLPAVSSSKNCIDFGQADVEAENAERKIPETLCLTNHSQSDVLIKWDQGCCLSNQYTLLLAFYFTFYLSLYLLILPLAE